MKSQTKPAITIDQTIPAGSTIIEELFNLLKNPALIVNASVSKIISANQVFLELTGYNTKEVEGAPIYEIITGDTLFPFSVKNQKSVRLIRKDQTTIEAKLTIHSLSPDSTKYLLIFSLQAFGKSSEMRDLFQVLRRLSRIVEEPTIEKASKRIIELVKTLLDTEIILIYNADVNFPRLRRIASTVQGRIFPENLPSTELVRLNKPFLWQPGTRSQSELHQFSEKAPIQFLASVPLGQEGAWFGLLVVGDTRQTINNDILDVLELIGDQISLVIQYYILVNNLEKQISQQEQLLLIRNSLLENDYNGILVLGKDLKIREINATAEWILGYAVNEVIDQPVENIIIGPESFPNLLASALMGMPTHNMGNVILHRRDGTPFPAHVQIVPVMQDESPVAIMIFISDVSEKEQIRERTQQLEHRAVLGEVIAIFAHEVRNPINNISTGLQLLSSKLSSDDPNQDLISRMLLDCQRLNHLMESVLAFSRPIEPKFEDLEISELLKRVLDRWRPRMARENITPFFQTENQLPKIVGDPRSLEQVFINLISNAINAMGKNNGGTLAIKLISDDSISNHPQVEISVSDSGPGIPEDIRGRLFDPFITTSVTGTGLGLAITKRIVTAHHGTIKVDSFPGGTIFRVYLPVAKGD
jgi:two-component system sensor histidine kinase AtoS